MTLSIKNTAGALYKSNDCSVVRQEQEVKEVGKNSDEKCREDVRKYTMVIKHHGEDFLGQKGNKRNLAIASRSRVSCAHNSNNSKVTQRSLKIIGSVTVRYSAYDFLLPFHSKCDPILYRFLHNSQILVENREIYIQLYVIKIWQPNLY